MLLLLRHPPRLLPHPPRLLPLANARERRSFEGASLPSQPQVGGVVGRHNSSWNSYVMESWAVKVLDSSYCVPFHHLSPVIQEPQEFPSYSSESIQAQALQEEVNEMLVNRFVRRK